MASMQILLGVTAMVAICSAGYHNKYKQSFSYYCPSGKGLGSFQSSYYNYDRRYAFQCDSKVGTYSVSRNCFMTPYVNYWRENFSFICPLNSVPAGVYSYYHGSYYDRRWKFRCCFVKTRFLDCHWKSHWVNDIRHYNYFRLRRAIVKGYRSYYYSSYKDRRWNVYLCYKN